MRGDDRGMAKHQPLPLTYDGSSGSRLVSWFFDATGAAGNATPGLCAPTDTFIPAVTWPGEK